MDRLVFMFLGIIFGVWIAARLGVSIGIIGWLLYSFAAIGIYILLFVLRPKS